MLRGSRALNSNFLPQLILLTVFFVISSVYSFAQIRQVRSCEDSDYDCLDLEYARKISPVCKGDNECWRTEYTKIIESNPNAGAAYLGRGRYFGPNQPDLAIQDYYKSIELNPDYYQSYVAAALLFATTKNYDRALVEINRAMEVAQQEARDGGHRKKSYIHNAHINRGFIHLQKGDYERALADYNRAIELNPSGDRGYAGRGSVYTTLRDHDKAIADYSKAIELSPEDWFNYYFRGHLYVAHGEKAKGEADLEKSKKLREAEAKR